MKTALIAGLLALGMVASAQAAEQAAELMVQPRHADMTCRAAEATLSRAAFTLNTVPETPRNCCKRDVQCAQFLSTTPFARDPHQSRT